MLVFLSFQPRDWLDFLSASTGSGSGSDKVENGIGGEQGV
jgi:hypothetical protein